MNYKRVTKCRSCGSPIRNILSLGEQRVVGFGDELPPKVPLTLALCENCKLLQLRHTTDPSLLWGEDYGYRSGVNQTMRDELKDVVDKTLDIVSLTEEDIVLDIGCNDGTLLSYYPEGLTKVGFDPSDIVKYAGEVLKEPYQLYHEYFNAKTYLKNNNPYSAKIITAVAMFYDLDDPNKFIDDITQCLSFQGVIIIQQNYLLGMLEQTAFDNICHEHAEYYSLLSLESLLARHGLEVFDVTTNNINGGSFRTYIRRKNSCVYSNEGVQRIKDMYNNEARMGLFDPMTYLDFAKRVENSGKDLVDLIKSLKGKKIYVYGASTRGGTLLQYCGLGPKEIIAAADRNPDKWGKVMQSTGIPIVSEEEGRAKADYFLVLPWFFKTEMVKREAEFLKKGHMIFPLPKLEVI